MAGRPRGFETVGDMLRSLAVVGVMIAVVVVLTVPRWPDGDEHRVDPTPVVQAVAQTAPFEALVPPATPDGWRPTSARITPPGQDPFSWYVGYVTDEDRFVAVSESDDARDPFLRSIGVSGTADGTSTVDGAGWERLTDADGLHRSLVREDEDVVRVVTGTVSFEQLEDFAAALDPVGPGTPVAPATP